MSKFNLFSNYQPSGDQPKAIQEITNGLKEGTQDQVLLGVTGSGKTFTIANVIKNLNRPVLVLSHNKTLASQLYSELKSFFPNNAVEYFISYFDYYKPEAYIPSSDTYIEKTSETNADIELLRMSTVNSLLKRRDVIVVASVSSIYGALNPNEYQRNIFEIYNGLDIELIDFLRKLSRIKYKRNDDSHKPGTFSVKGDVILIAPADTEEHLIRINFFGDQIEGIFHVHPLTKNVMKSFKTYVIYPGEAYTVGTSVFDEIIPKIEKELEERVNYFSQNDRLVEIQRLSDRIQNDIHDMKEFGFCSGIENYTMYLDGRDFGDRPYTLLDYMPSDSLIFIDESHMMIPQLNGMYKGDHSRKQTLVDYGFRLPSCLENRPLRFEEFEQDFNFQKVYISATPGNYELDKTYGVVTRLYVRPTGLLDPKIEIRPQANQIEDIYDEIIKQNKKNERTLILTTTKRMAEELSAYLQDKKIKAGYIHADHNTFVRNEILRKLRKGIFDVVVGVNLLREGIDLPEVSLVIVLDADKQGFMRNTKSLIQITGRAARNSEGRVIFYADKITQSINDCINDNKEKREIQMAYNKKHNIVPKTIIKPIPQPIQGHDITNALERYFDKQKSLSKSAKKSSKQQLIEEIRKQMNEASKKYDFEKAIELRDILLELEKN